MSSLLAEINKLCKFYANYLQTAGSSSGTGEKIFGNEAGEDVPSQTAETAAGAGSFNLAVFRPANRADALLLLRKGAEYFQRQEPNSPIPLLINRALRFSEMNFIDLLEDIVPDALSQGKKILGVRESDS